MRCIDENAVIKMLNTMDRYTSEELTLCDTDKTFPKNEVFIVDDVYEGLDELPTIDPVRKGHWDKVDETPYIRKHFNVVCCSVCRKKGYTAWNYCPNCGAKMERGD